MQNEYFDAAMQMDPTALPEDRQRAVANQMRGLSQVGAMGSTSQIGEIASAGNQAMAQSADMGKQMGLDKAKKREEANRTQRARLTASARAGYQTKADKDQLLPSRPERTAMEVSITAMQVLDKVKQDYKPEFSGTGQLGFGDRLRSKGMRYEPGITTGILDWAAGKLPEGMIEKDAKIPNVKADGTPLSEKEYEGLMEEHRFEKDQFWRSYQNLYTLPTRNRLFGATLTTGEEESWNSANIGPDSTTEQIESQIKMLQDIAEGVARRQLGKFGSMGVSSKYMKYNTDEVNRYMREPLPSVEVEEVSGPAGVEIAEEVGANLAPEGVEQSEWDSLSEEDRIYYIDNEDMFR